MNTIVLFVLFLGIICIMHGTYQQQLDHAKKQVKIEYRFVPRSLYDEQLQQVPDVSRKFKGMFTDSRASPWEPAI